MKNGSLITIIVLILLLPNAVNAAPKNNPIFATIDSAHQWIAEAVSPLSTSISDIFSELSEHGDRIEVLEEQAVNEGMSISC